MSHLHPGLKMYGTPLSMSRLTSNQPTSTSTHVLISAFHHHPGDVSPPSSSRNLHFSSIQIPSQSHESQYVCLTSIQALSYIYPSYKIFVSPPSMYHLASIQAPIFGPQLHTGANICVSHLTTSYDVLLISIHVQSHRHLGLEIWVSLPSMSHLISFQVLIFASHLI